MIRTLRLVLVSMLFACGLVVVPVPTMVWAEELETVTRTVGLARALSVEARGLLRESPLADHAHETNSPHAAEAVPTHARQGGEARTDPFTAIGVTLDAEPDGSIAFRVRERGQWGPWRELSFSEDHAPEGDEAERANETITSDPFVVDRATGYQIQVPDNVRETKVHLVTVTDRRVRIEVGDDEAGAGTPAVHPRSAWGARAPRSAPGEASELSMAVVHHSAGASNQPTATLLRSIQAFHMDTRGWDDIGYNFAVDRTGAVWEARAGGIDRAIIGAHAGGFNTGSVGVVILGDYDAAAPTSASLSALHQIIGWKFALHHVPSTGHHRYHSVGDTQFGPAGTGIWLPRVIGHRDVGVTSCPGGNVYGRLGSIRTGTNNAVGPDRPVVPAKVLMGRWNGDARDDLMMYRPGPPEDRRWYGAAITTSTGLPIIGGTLSEPSLTGRSANISGLYEPITGDFDGNGVDDVFWYGAGSQPDYIWFGTSNGGYQDKATTVGAWYQPFVGDFNGDDRDDIFWYRPDGPNYVWYGRADRTFSSRDAIRPGGIPQPLVGDFDGDGRDDILFYGPGSRADEIQFGRSGAGFDRSTGINVSGFYRPFVGDFSGDGRDDVFWYKPGPGSDHLWTGRANGTFDSRAMTVSGVFDPVVGDFDGNGTDDVFWSRSDGQDHLWLFRSGDVFSTPGVAVSSRFNAQGTLLSGPYLTVLDADGDGKDELFAQEHPTGGRLWFWDAAGTLRSKSVG